MLMLTVNIHEVFTQLLQQRKSRYLSIDPIATATRSKDFPTQHATLFGGYTGLPQERVHLGV